MSNTNPNSSAVDPATDSPLRVALDAALSEAGGKTYWNDKLDVLEAAVRSALGDGHFVVFTADRWTVEHSIDCRLSGRMHECQYHAAISLFVEDFEDDLIGRWRITGFFDGLPRLERAEEAT